MKNLSFRASFVSETMMCGQHKDFRVFSPSMNNLFAIPAPVKAMNKARDSYFTVFNIFLGMLRCMVAWGYIFTVVIRTFIKINVNIPINVFRGGSEPSGMSARRMRMGWRQYNKADKYLNQ